MVTIRNITDDKIANNMRSSLLIHPGEMIKDEIIARGLTQKELATAIDMTQGGYVSYEIARREPPLTTLKRLSKTLGRTTDWLLGIGT